MDKKAAARHSRCKQCGFRRRGKNHDEGRHHKAGMALDAEKKPYWKSQRRYTPPKGY